MARPLDWDRARSRERARQDDPAPVRVGRAGDLPATPKQLALLRRLGVQHGGGLTRRGASTLIDRAKRQGGRGT